MEANSFLEVHRVGLDIAKPQSVLSRWSASWRSRPVKVQTILDDVSFRLNQGEWMTLYGGPGAGKTTLLRLITGVAKPSRGRIIVNGKDAAEHGGLAVGYVSLEESENLPDTVENILHTFGRTHALSNLPSRLGPIVEALSLQQLLHRTAASLSTTEQLRLNLARAALSDTPVILLDDVADTLGTQSLKATLFQLFQNRSVIIATRSPAIAESMGIPVLLLHGGKLACSGTCNEMASHVAAPRTLDVWVEGIRYDLFRTIKKHPGVAQVLLLPDGRFHGQRLRITLKSGHHLPALYDLVSRVPLIRVEELPVSLEDILSRL